MIAYVENSARPETWARDTGITDCFTLSKSRYYDVQFREFWNLKMAQRLLIFCVSCATGSWVICRPTYFQLRKYILQLVNDYKMSVGEPERTYTTAGYLCFKLRAKIMEQRLDSYFCNIIIVSLIDIFAHVRVKFEMQTLKLLGSFMLSLSYEIIIQICFWFVF